MVFCLPPLRHRFNESPQSYVWAAIRRQTHSSRLPHKYQTHIRYFTTFMCCGCNMYVFLPVYGCSHKPSNFEFLPPRAKTRHSEVHEAVDPFKWNCENIQSWILYVSDLVFRHQGEIYGFEFPKRVFGDLFQRSHSFVSFLDLII